MEKIPKKSFKPREVAEILGCTTDQIYRLIKYGQLEAFHIGNRRFLRITETEINDFLERMKVRNKEMKIDG